MTKENETCVTEAETNKDHETGGQLTHAVLQEPAQRALALERPRKEEAHGRREQLQAHGGHELGGDAVDHRLEDVRRVVQRRAKLAENPDQG